jgi:hypothetical protein
METSAIEKLASVFTAIGTVAVAVAAIWGDWIRSKFAGPKLELALVNRWDRNTGNDGRRQIYCHLEVRNLRRWSPAKNVRVVVEGLAKRKPDGTFFPEYLVVPLQLTWGLPTFHELLPTIGPQDRCDLGLLQEGSGQFRLSTYIWPNNFRGFLAAGEAMQVRAVALGQDAASNPLLLEISWDGTWSADLEEMQRHFVVKETTGAPS